MNGITGIPAPASYKDRRAGLIAFGVLEILLGCVSLLMMAAMTFAMVVLPRLDDALSRQALDARTIVPSMAIYGIAAASLIWLGIGSILCRRWARTLIVIGSWSAVLGGILGIVFSILFARDILTRAGANAIATFALIFTAIIMTIFFIVLPTLMGLFYESRNVIATCEARDPHLRWTDRCPMPVLATSLWLVLGSLSCLLMPVSYQSVMPWFGSLLSGTPATLTILALMAIGFYLAWGMYRLQMASWWIALIGFTILSTSATITFLRVDVFEFYRLMGYPAEQLELLRSMKFFSTKIIVGWMVICYVLLLIFLVWIRKYFRKENAVQQ